MEAMWAVMAQPAEVIPVLPQPEEGMSQAPRWVAGVRAAVGTPEVGRQVAGLLPAVTTNLPEVEPTPAIGAQPKASLMDKGRAHPCLMGGALSPF